MKKKVSDKEFLFAFASAEKQLGCSPSMAELSKVAMLSESACARRCARLASWGDLYVRDSYIRKYTTKPERAAEFYGL